MKDLLNKEIGMGDKVVYPARPGGHGPLQLIQGEVTWVEESLGEIDVQVAGSNRPLRIRRTDRVAVVE